MFFGIFLCLYRHVYMDYGHILSIFTSSKNRIVGRQFAVLDDIGSVYSRSRTYIIGYT